jgi:hypothetical protein
VAGKGTSFRTAVTKKLIYESLDRMAILEWEDL